MLGMGGCYRKPPETAPISFVIGKPTRNPNRICKDTVHDNLVCNVFNKHWKPLDNFKSHCRSHKNKNIDQICQRWSYSFHESTAIMYGEKSLFSTCYTAFLHAVSGEKNVLQLAD